MAKKYNKINKNQVLELFAEKEIINKNYIANKLNCSIYSVRRELELLKDEGLIKVWNHGFKLIHK